LIHESDPDEWWDVQTINIKGTYLPSREFLRRNLGRPELTILNINSIACAGTRPGGSSYHCSKSQLNRFTEFLHFEYQDANVRTFTFHPGAVKTVLSKYVIPEHGHDMLGDSPELPGGFALWLATQGKKADFLRGRFISANWDVNDLLEREEEIVKKGLLFMRVLGYEQGVELRESVW